jgi:preprotein translocase subunit SecA
MANILTKGIAKLFGTKSEKDIKAIMPYVEKINKAYDQLSSISDDDLRKKKVEVKAVIDAHLKTIDDEVAGLSKKVEEDTSLDIHAKDDIFKEIDALEEKRNVELEVVLMEVLPDAFAIIK